MQPFYFPFVSGRGLNLQGYFDYRPRNINEAVVAATSADGGKTWTFEQQVENLYHFMPAERCQRTTATTTARATRMWFHSAAAAFSICSIAETATPISTD